MRTNLPKTFDKQLTTGGMLEFSLGESSRVVPELHLTPFSKCKVKNFKNPCFSSLASYASYGPRRMRQKIEKIEKI